MQEKRDEREKIGNHLRKADDAIAKIEEHRHVAEELPTLQQQYEQLAAQQHRLEGNIDGYMKSRKLSAGGQCPLLHQPCLNINQLGMVSIETYFDDLLAEEHAQLAILGQQLVAVNDRMPYVKKYADGLSKLGQYIESRDTQVERLRAAALDITRLEREVADLEHDLEELKLLDQQIAQAKTERDESKKADQQVRELEGLRTKIQQLQSQVQQYTTDLEERQQQANELRESANQLKEVEQQLQPLNNPRSPTN